MTTFDDAVALAETFATVTLGVLQGANVLFAGDGAPAPIRLVSSVIGQEGEQNGYYRLLLSRISSESPFSTTVPAPLALSALLQNFVVPGSCPFSVNQINLPVFPVLMTNVEPVALLEPQDQTLHFGADLTGVEAAAGYVCGDGSGLYMTYTTGQQIPSSVGVSNVLWQGRVIRFEAEFPYEERVMAGFSQGAFKTAGSFADADAVVAATLAAPAILQVNTAL